MREDFKIINQKLADGGRVVDNILTLFAYANENYAKCDDLSYYVNKSYVDELKCIQEQIEEEFLNNIAAIEFDKSTVEFEINSLGDICVKIWLNIDRNRVAAMPVYQSLAFKYLF